MSVPLCIVSEIAVCGTNPVPGPEEENSLRCARVDESAAPGNLDDSHKTKKLRGGAGPVGRRYTRRGMVHKARCSGEVILTAGAYNRDEDTLSVVDLQLRVRGATGLRICDASIMPRIPGANTNAPTMAIADRYVDLMMPTG